MMMMMMHLTNREDYNVTVRGPTTHKEGEITFHANNVNLRCCIAVKSKTFATVMNSCPSFSMLKKNCNVLSVLDGNKRRSVENIVDMMHVCACVCMCA